MGAVQNECSGMDEPLDIKGFHITGHPDDDVNGVYTKRDYGGLSNEQRKMVNKGLYERCFWTRKTESRLFCMTGDDAGVKGGGFDIQSFALPIKDGESAYHGGIACEKYRRSHVPPSGGEWNIPLESGSSRSGPFKKVKLYVTTFGRGVRRDCPSSDFLLSTSSQSCIFQHKGLFEAMPLFRCTYIQCTDEVHPQDPDKAAGMYYDTKTKTWRLLNSFTEDKAKNSGCNYSIKSVGGELVQGPAMYRPRVVRTDGV